MFEFFTRKAIKVIMLAQEEGRRMGHHFVGTEQILLGLVGEGTGIAGKILNSMGVTLEEARVEVEKIIGRGSSAVVIIEVPFTPRAKRLLEFAWDEARLLGHNYIGTEHVLLGLIREGNGVGPQVLLNLGLDLGLVRTKVMQYLFELNAVKPNLDATPHPNAVDGSNQVTGNLSPEQLLAICSKLSENAIKVHTLAQEETRRLGQSSVGTEEILLGLVAVNCGIAGKALRDMGVELDDARIEVEKITLTGSFGSVVGEIPYTPRAKWLLEQSELEAKGTGAKKIGTGHLLLALIKEEAGLGVRVLVRLKVDIIELRKKLISIMTSD